MTSTEWVDQMEQSWNVLVDLERDPAALRSDPRRVCKLLGLYGDGQAGGTRYQIVTLNGSRTPAPT
ncbi:MAG: hypothetical protein JO181_21655 [Solirubrobacterales bacterium]|nr:hypothetical protein [Solirubrobacterales bacterium]